MARTVIGGLTASTFLTLVILPYIYVLFDNLADPYQLHNLAADPAMQAVCDYLSEQMEAKMASLNDTFELSSYYKEHWVDNNRCIIRTATSEA